MSPRPVVAVTRDEGLDGPLARRLAALGASVLALPTIAIEPPEDPAPLDSALAGLGGFEWIAFTSARAVEGVVGRPHWGAAWATAQHLRVGAIGHETARVLSVHGIPVHATALAPTGRGLVEAMAAVTSLRGVRVLWPRSSLARPDLEAALHDAGALLAGPVAYRTRALLDNARELARRLAAGEVHAIAFLSPSSAKALSDAVPPGNLAFLAGRVVVASIGPTTTEALRRLGAPPDVEPDVRSAEALADALIEHLLHAGASA